MFSLFSPVSELVVAAADVSLVGLVGFLATDCFCFFLSVFFNVFEITQAKKITQEMFDDWTALLSVPPFKIKCLKWCNVIESISAVVATPILVRVVLGTFNTEHRNGVVVTALFCKNARYDSNPTPQLLRPLCSVRSHEDNHKARGPLSQRS